MDTVHRHLDANVYSEIKLFPISYYEGNLLASTCLEGYKLSAIPYNIFL